jgi:hypothetical protein
MGFSERFPRWTSAVLAVIQIGLTTAIIGLELGSSIIDLAHGTIWVGYWTGLVFIYTLVMMLFISKLNVFFLWIFICIYYFLACCCRGRCCATYVLFWTGK